jgi:antitoxin component of MazEF toxin-antitoxin module
MSYIDNHDKPEVRKIQAIHGNTTFVLVVPREFVEKLKISKGDYVKCTIVDDTLLVKKAGVSG